MMGCVMVCMQQMQMDESETETFDNKSQNGPGQDWESHAFSLKTETRTWGNFPDFQYFVARQAQEFWKDIQPEEESWCR